ncbi:DNA-binding transcriptional regulator, AcrR family [Parafrankia irregularis]|uniref:DNA-binding transcriptional regulator, AcrR family n=1 Tax=Parafrankia irregularis TaxID=795642 RepID=A0A0S4QHL2_9ACTN|nr:MULTISPECIES: TetR/AcrR family transcriptional regulator [Parafrankia]MBE3204052.1 TetR/AcrR family transcriptional regulator [Parafrankia sp. CH37]CUU55072.1 DNA-binding transcriptional regulator, AcrR family [Parafrankia irregularis]
MATPRRTGTESSATRAFLLDVTERIMREDGYAAVSSRTVAKSAGVTPALIHYYFPTLDDLFVALFRRGAERNLERQEALLASSRPLHEVWALVTDAGRTALLTEFMALGNHRKIIRDEIAAYSKRSRRQLTDLLTSRMAQYEPGLAEIPPPALIFLIGAVSRAFVSEQAIGVSEGHAEMLALVERLLAQLEPGQPAATDGS